MLIIVFRRWLSSQASIGRLHVAYGGKFSCYTLEDEVRPKGEKIAGETAIPYGFYPLSLHYWSKHQITVPLINNVPMFSGILIHMGNTTADTTGCLLVGYGKNGDTLTQSSKCFSDLNALITEKINAGKKVNILFVNVEQIAAAIFILLAIIVGAIYIYMRNR